MLKLTISQDSKIKSEFEITTNTTTLGRHDNNDICIDNLSVSSRHAQILKVDDECFIEDLNSSNGTYVNGNLIKKYALKSGDKIKIGKYEIKFQDDAVVASSAPQESEFERTMIIRPDSVGMPESAGNSKIDKQMGEIAARIASEQKVAKAPVSIGKASLQVLSGANAGKKLPLTKVLTTLGKPGVQVAAITRRPTGYYILHVEGGANAGHPTINGDVVGSKASPLNNNDIIEVAGIKMEFNVS
ncbi:MAG: FHA domain-containing protein [Gammaproteobacteria bacterium]|nr:FHA domain-containing protein [Gammaproteobacteria bacterium]